MAELQKFEPYIGAVAVGCLSALLALTIAFAGNLIKFGHPIGGLAAASVILGCLALSGILFVGGRRFYYERNGQTSKSAQWRLQKTTLAIAILVIAWSLLAMATFIWILCARRESIPPNTLGMPTQYLVYIALILWAISGLSQGLYIINIANVVRNELHVAQNSTIDEEGLRPAEMARISNTETDRSQSSNKASTDIGSPVSKTSSRKRSGSDTRSSIRNSFSNAIRPMSSKSRLIGYKYNGRPTSIDSGTGERECLEESFDSWDTSAVEVPAWQNTLSSGVTISCPLSTIASQHPRILETIPASPATSSRSQSPGDPLDFPPPNTYARRSRSQSPASFRVAHSEHSGSHSSVGSEKHIHPLFRSDSPTPPPSATPNSIITAAPNAGQLLSDLTAVRRKRSGSLQAPSPLVHSTSFDNIALESTRESKSQGADVEEHEKVAEAPSPVVERAMTPPIPDWILGAGHRTSLHGYAKRKSGKGQVGDKE